MPFPDNSPVSFGPDINTEDCNCIGQPYCQLVETPDVTRFQLPNNCPPTWGSEMIANGTFAVSLASWSQGTGNGSVNDWTQSSGKAVGVPTSRILNQAVTISQFNKYKLSLDVTLGSGCTIYVVGYRSYTGDDSTDYVILATITSTGTHVMEITASEDYVRIGFYVEGDCENSDLDNISLLLASYECLDICIQDTEGNLVENVPSSDISYYGDFIYVKVDWAAMGITPGCYKICICNEDDLVFAENLFTLGDNGTFEEDSTGISSNATDPARSTTRAYRGVYSYGMTFTGGAVALLITSDITLKRSTRYRLSARVWADMSSYSAPTETILWKNPASTGFSGATRHSYTALNIDTQDEEWIEVNVEFTTNNSDAVGHFEIESTAVSVTGGQVFIDNIILYEVDEYDTCSQCISLSDTHTCTLLLEWYSDEPTHGFYYDGTIDIKHILRVRGKLRNANYEGEKETFRDTDGTRKIVYAEKERVIQLILEDQPAYVHDAIAAALDHDHFLIDGVEYVNKQPEYSPNWRKSSHVAPVIIDLVKKTQNLSNSYC